MRAFYGESVHGQERLATTGRRVARAGFETVSRVTLLSGGVGGARAARGFAAIVASDDLAVIVNVGDDERIHGVHVAADVDTVVYTLAGLEGPDGWGRADDTFTVMAALDRLGADTTFRIGDTDLATCLARTAALDAGKPLGEVTARIASSLGVEHRVLPVTNDPVRTQIVTTAGERLGFQDYFVFRRHRDEVAAVSYEGAATARPAPGVLEALTDADLVVIAPSNPPLSIWPILAVPGVREAVAAAHRVVAVSPLFGGKALKGPADRVMASLGLPPGNEGVLAAYAGLLSALVVDIGDAADVDTLAGEVTLHATDTRIEAPQAAARLAEYVMALS
jgi:LPPG:FO 2-phospho-L-lactate transferase